MVTIIPTEKASRQKRRRTSLLFCSLLAAAATSGGLEVNAFGVSSAATTLLTPRKTSSSLQMKSEMTTSHRSSQTSRTTNGTPSADLISRKAALIDSSHVSGVNSRSTPTTSNGSSSSSSERIRVRVNSFLRSKKRRPEVVKEIKDVDSIYSALGEGQKESVYTAIIFHAPYCRACKASIPLFEKLARQYDKQHRKQIKRQSKRSWMAAGSSSSKDPPSRNHSRNKQPIVKFLSVPVTQDNSKELQDQFSVTKFPLAHIYDPVDGLVDERPVLRKLFPEFQKRLDSVLEESISTSSTSEPSPMPVVLKNATLAY